jgi:hypothetical protein
MSVKADVDGGVCGFQTRVLADSDDGQHVSFQITSGCERIRGLAAGVQGLGPVDTYQEISTQNDSVVMGVVRQHLKGCCAGCAVPVAIFKSMQVAAGLALPKDVSVRISAE